MVGGTLVTVKKTSLYLEPDVDRALARRASAEGVTKAELIRRALTQLVNERPRPKPHGVGIFEGPGDVAENVDRQLSERGFGRD